MNCPKCGAVARVYDSRPFDDHTWRRRKCVECKHKFTTVEIDGDYYAEMKPIDKKAVQKALCDGFENITNMVHRALEIEKGV